MTKVPRYVCFVVLAAMLVPAAHAAVVADWDFSNGTTLPNNATLYSPTLLNAPTLTSSGGMVPGTITAGGLHFEYNGNHANDLNGIVITLSLTARGTIALSTLTYNATATGGFSSLNGTWAYAIAGGSSGTLATAPVGNTTVNLSSITLHAGDALTLSYTLSGATGRPNGVAVFDDFILNASSISPIPEPTHYALAGFGLLFVIWQVRRIQSQRSKSNAQLSR